MARSFTKANSVKSWLGTFVFASFALMSSRCCKATTYSYQEPYNNDNQIQDFYLIDFIMEHIPTGGAPITDQELSVQSVMIDRSECIYATQIQLITSHTDESSQTC